MKRKFWKTSCTLYIKRAIAWPPPFHLSHNGHLAANLINFVLACYVPRVHQPEWPHWLNSCISHATAAAAKGRGGQTGRKEEVAGKIRPERAVTVTAERQLAAHHNRVHQVLTECSYSRSDFSSFSFSFPFSCIFRARRNPRGRGLKCQLTKGTGVENLQEKNSPHIISHAWRHPHPIRIPKAIPIQTV